MDINPYLYKLFDIQAVPTIVYIPDIIKNNSHATIGKDNVTILSWIGDVALKYILEQFKLERPFDPILNRYIDNVKTQDGDK